MRSSLLEARVSDKISLAELAVHTMENLIWTPYYEVYGSSVLSAARLASLV